MGNFQPAQPFGRAVVRFGQRLRRRDIGQARRQHKGEYRAEGKVLFALLGIGGGVLPAAEGEQGEGDDGAGFRPFFEGLAQGFGGVLSKHNHLHQIQGSQPQQRAPAHSDKFRIIEHQQQ